MKKTVFTLLLAAGAILPLSAKTNVEEQWNFGAAQSRMLQSDAHLYVRPFVVELQLTGNERLSWKMRFGGEEYVSRWSLDSRGEVNPDQTKINMQNYAVYKASVGEAAPIGSKEGVKCDVIVAPLFNMSFSQDSCIIEFTGYPAVYSNWHTATPDEFDKWIKFDHNQSDTKKTVNGTVGVQEVEVRTVQNSSTPLGRLTGK